MAKTDGFDDQVFLKTVTRKAGIYMMLDRGGEVIYVGKAKNLRNRLSSYFRASGLTTKTMALVSKIHQIEVTVTSTENEALILEQNLIKQYRPQYNIMLKDDKSYPYIYISNHESPRITIHRGARRGKGQYFGPYPSAGSVKESLYLMQKLFKVRQCEDSYFSHRSRPCLQYQIGRCSGPCVGKVSKEDYADDVRRTAMFLLGKNNEVVKELADKMEDAAAELAFEKAAQYRDQIGHLQRVQASQYIDGETGDLDIIAIEAEQGLACVHLLYVRGGRVLGSRSYFPKSKLGEGSGDILEAFIAQHYLGGSGEIPRELIVSEVFEGKELLSSTLSQQAGRIVSIVHKVRGNRAKWQGLAVTAAQQNLKNRLANNENSKARLKSLTEVLGLEAPPNRMECFDISHSSGEATVASCVVFDEEGPKKSDYRKFNIEGIEGGDDYAAMRQALTRRYKRIKSGEIVLPDILFIDGGKGQLTQAKEVLDELDVRGVLMVAVAKGSDRKAGLEILIRGDNGKEIVLPSHTPALHLIQHIRDESHRFAITGHKMRRDKARRQSSIEGIPGVGAKRRKELFRHFGGIQGIKKAGVEDLQRVPGISAKLAQDIYDYLQSA